MTTNPPRSSYSIVLPSSRGRMRFEVHQDGEPIKRFPFNRDDTPALEAAFARAQAWIDSIAPRPAETTTKDHP